MTDTGIARAAVLGMLAGAVGTVAMTVTQQVEMSLSGRSPSTVPGQVGAHLVPGADPAVSADVARLNGPVHWGHGIAMGALRGVLDVAGLHGPAATAAHFALVWGGDATLYRALGVADVPWRWSSAELGADLLHKGVYAAVTGVVYDALPTTTTR
jgi:hypothetical protein